MTDTQRLSPPTTPGLPIAGLAALATAGFITIMTEALPAGMLPALSASLGVSTSAAGQLITVFALGSILAAIPLTAATLRVNRKVLLLCAISGFAVANTTTALSSSFTLSMAARFIAGVAAGLVWSLLVGYARRMVAPQIRGRATAVAMAGTPVALALGIPAGTFAAAALGWRTTFAIVSALTVALLLWTLRHVPSFPGQPPARHIPLLHTLRIPGIVTILAVTLTAVLSHNILYTYIAPFLTAHAMAERVDVVLLMFGIASLISIWATARLIDAHARRLTLVGMALLASAAVCLAVATDAWLIYLGAALWGLGFGGAATLLQTAAAEAAGSAGDVAQSLIVTTWNVAIAGGAAVGGGLTNTSGATALPWAALALLIPAVATVVCAGRHAFPHHGRRAGVQPPQ